MDEMRKQNRSPRTYPTAKIGGEVRLAAYGKYGLVTIHDVAFLEGVVAPNTLVIVNLAETFSII